MFEKLITDFKKSLPESLRNKFGGAEAITQEVKSESSIAPEEDKNKKRISMIIRVVVILGLAYFVVDEFVLKSDQPEPNLDELTKAPIRKKKKKLPSETEKAVATATDPKDLNDSKSPVTNQETPLTDPGSTESANETAPIENVNILDKNTTTSPETATNPANKDELASNTVETKVSEANLDQKIDQLVDNVDQSAMVEEVKIPSQSASKEVIGETKTKSKEEGKKEEKKEEPTMASKIVEEETETLPPTYDHLGRGLVYNCKDKYWACVDKPTYITCNRNMKWNKSKANAAECVVQNIYSSEEDCGKVQKYNVSMNVSTAFCQD